MRFLLTLVIVCSTAAAYAEEPFADLSFEDACKKAKEEKKIVLIDFCTTWCQPCKKLDRTTWKDEKVRQWLGKYAISLKVNAEKNRKLASRYKVKSFPTILFLNDDGTEMDRITGYRPPDAFLEDAKGAISGKDSVTRAKEKMDAGGKNNPMQRIQYGQTLAQKGKHSEALEEYLWCFDHGLEASPAFAGVRLSFLLGNIHQLGVEYKPAIKALVERRDRAEKAMLDVQKSGKKNAGFFPFAGDSRFQSAMECAAINRELDESDRTMAIYEKLISLGESDALLLNVLLEEILDDLVEARRYKAVIAGIPDPLANLEQEIQGYLSIKAFEKNRGRDVPKSSPHFRVKALDKGAKMYEALVGTKDWDNAHKVARRLLKFNKKPKTYQSLMRHAVRAKRASEVDWLLEQARKKLKADDLDQIEKFAEEVKSKS